MAESRTTLFNLKVTPTELKTIKAIALQQGMTPSQLVRDAIADKFHKHFTARRLAAAEQAARTKEADSP